MHWGIVIAIIIGTDKIWATLVLFCSFWFDHSRFLAFFQHLKVAKKLLQVPEKYLASWFLGTSGKTTDIAIDTDASSFARTIRVELLTTSKLLFVIKILSWKSHLSTLYKTFTAVWRWQADSSSLFIHILNMIVILCWIPMVKRFVFAQKRVLSLTLSKT